MATAKLGRTRRFDKTYSRARDRADLMRTIEEDLNEDFVFPLAQVEDDDPHTPSLAALMSEPAGADADG